MKRSLVAIGIDAPNNTQFNRWLENGQLPNISSLIKEGFSGVVSHRKHFRNERCWNIFLGGQDFETAGSVFLPSTYDYFNESLQREDRYEPFYALGDPYRVCVFDLPATINDNVKGIQICGWASELNACTPTSSPPDVLPEIHRHFGPDPKLTRPISVRDHKTGETELSFVLPSLYDRAAILDFKHKLLTSIERRTDIALNLLARETWDLYLGLYPESHTANHVLWHVGEAHPLAEMAPPGHAQLEILQAIDVAVGRIAASLPPSTCLMIFTIDHTAANTVDVPSMALLPELLFRWNFPGEQALAPGNIGQPVPPRHFDYHQHWKHELWSLVTHEGKAALISPTEQEAQGDPLNWNVANWYKPLWPRMKAFALPSIGDGYIRLNIKGREAAGSIEPTAYSATLEEIEALLMRTINPRNGQPLVKGVLRTRSNPFDAEAIPPDLIVCWADGEPTDTLDSPDIGRIGPLPYFRSGGHVAHGTPVENLFAVRGEGITRGVRTAKGGLNDLGPTMLEILGARPANGSAGRSLL